MRKPIVLKKKSGKKIAIDAMDIDRVIEEEGMETRTVVHRKGTTYAVTDTFQSILDQITRDVKKTK